MDSCVTQRSYAVKLTLYREILDSCNSTEKHRKSTDEI